ncbi:VOC family protein [Geodermatophilus sp. TF02-6]|uniref:VOC family protein n=1 Tax=Geodermatophilus sp. TF02-6 TaxID=2250575 RepID=UPI000DE84CD7|nr:VOC family protein [Geodermatophilus sp. TF02-6]RBY76815.1 VOC family protein [Geodermatophilus sp. TF02-6]
MRTLHVGLRVADLDRSLAFYRALGYELVGSVPDTPLGRLTMLKLPGDDFVSLELVHDPAGDPVHRGNRLSHLVVQTADLDATTARLAAGGIDTEVPGAPDEPDEIRTAWVTDPDGVRIELVQWPPDHPDGMTAADFTD